MQYHKFPQIEDTDKYHLDDTKLYCLDYCKEGSNLGIYITDTRADRFFDPFGRIFYKHIQPKLACSLFDPALSQSSNPVTLIVEYLFPYSANNSLYDFFRSKIKILTYKNGTPHIVAITAVKKYDDLNSLNPVNEPVVMFLQLNLNSLNPGDPLNSFVLIDATHKETEDGITYLTANDLSVNEQDKILYVSYAEKIICIDYSDLGNISKVSEYKPALDPNRLNNIKNLEYDHKNQILACLTNNANSLYDTILFTYFSNATKELIFRSSYTENTNMHYSNFKIIDDYIYINNINYYDNQGKSTLRSTLGIQILLNNGSNYLDIQKKNVLRFGEYWNDTVVPANLADPGYIAYRAHRHYSILGIYENQLYSFVAPSEAMTNVDVDSIDYDSYIVQYDLSDKENPTMNGSDAVVPSVYQGKNKSKDQDYIPMNLLSIYSDNITGDYTFLKYGGIYPDEGEKALEIIKTNLINANNFSLYQQIDSLSDRFYDMDYLMVQDTTNLSISHQFLAIAQGTDGFRLMTNDIAAKQYRLLIQVKPQHNGQNIKITTINILNKYNHSTSFSIVCAGEGVVFVYNVEIASGNLSLTQTIDMATTLSLTDYDELINKHAHWDGLYNLAANTEGLIYIPLEVIRTR